MKNDRRRVEDDAQSGFVPIVADVVMIKVARPIIGFTQEGSMIVRMKTNVNIPRFVSIVAIALGSLDIVRGFIHTVLLEYAAANIAGLDLSTTQAGDLLQLMATFGISNYLTGVMLILMGWKARPLALVMLGVIPLAYLIGMVTLRVHSVGYASSQAAWGGLPMMMGYLLISTITFFAGVIRSRK
jgi:hypothetical protein